MTVIEYVTQEGMRRKTGLRGALGYALPKEDKILIRKGLTPEKKREVLAHEEDHILKGEEGPFWGQVIAAGASIVGGAMGARSAKKAAKAQQEAADQQIAFARETRNIARGDQAPYREAGYTALEQLMRLSGIPVPSTVSRAAELDDNPGSIDPSNIDAVFRRYRGRPPTEYEREYYSERPHEVQRVINSGFYAAEEAWYDKSGPTKYRGTVTRPEPAPSSPSQAAPQPEPQSVEEMVQTDPSYEFRLNESMRALERSAAARGGLLSGGFGRQAIRYASDYASTEYGKIYDRIANIAGLGMTGAANSGNAAIATGGVMANAASDAGYGRASGYVAQGNQWANALNEVSKIDWGSVFKGTPPPGGVFTKNKSGARDY